jgi:hypothetical protein
MTERITPTLTPDLAFEHCANAAAAEYQRAPAFVTYRVATHARAPSVREHRDVYRAVMVRTRDDLAVIQDLPQGRNQLGHGFPVPPTFDALSYFTLSWRVGYHQEVSSYVHDVTPLVYTDPANNGEFDVIVTRLRAYKAQYAPDSSEAPDGRTHLVLTPYQFIVSANSDETFYFNELYVDNATGLPSRVSYDGANGKKFVLDYGSVGGHWVLQHLHYEETLHGPLRIGYLHVIADADYDHFEFPDFPPDARLAG